MRRNALTLQREQRSLDLQEVQVRDNALQLYADGWNLYQAMLAAIDGAQESIYLEVPTWEDDPIGDDFKKHLAQKVAQGVAVYAIGGFSGNHSARHGKVFYPVGVQTLKYRPFHRPWHLVDPRRYVADHRKLLVVDGTTAFLGGNNPSNTYTEGWRDTHLRIRGPAAADLALTFIGLWNRFSTPRQRITHCYQRQFNPWIVVRANDALRLTFPIRDMYLDAIDRAEHSIWLTNTHFIPDQSLLNALKAARTRGVDVRIILPWPFLPGWHIARWLTQSVFSQCLQAGIRLFGYPHARFRSKTCTIDGAWSTLGSAHLDLLSAVGNYELNVEIYNASIASQLQALFLHDAASAVEVSLADWMKRPGLRRLSDWFLAPLRSPL